VAPARVAKDGWKANRHGAGDVNNVYGVVGLLVAGCSILTSWLCAKIKEVGVGQYQGLLSNLLHHYIHGVFYAIL